MPEVTVLEVQLIGLGRAIEWPAAPDVTSVIRRRIRTRRPWTESRWAMAAALAIVALAALVAYTPSRDAVAGWLFGARIHQVQVLPTISPRPSGPLGERLGLGVKITLPGASQAVTWKVLVPTSLGQPDEVYLLLPVDGPPGGEVTLVYGARPGIPPSSQTGVYLLVTEARGKVSSQYFDKFIGPDTTIEAVSVGGHQGLWISGSPHAFYFIDSAGNFRDETLRLAGNTLLLDFGGTVVRIEGGLTKEQALQIARSLT
jgi:hypothetical protein